MIYVQCEGCTAFNANFFSSLLGNQEDMLCGCLNLGHLSSTGGLLVYNEGAGSLFNLLTFLNLSTVSDDSDPFIRK